MSTSAAASPSAEDVVRGFLDEVRSGRDPGRAHHYMADQVLAHQLTGENETTIHRTPTDYAAHVDEMIAEHGHFTLEILTLVASNDLVAVVWRQSGEHPPTGTDAATPVIELAACTYRVDNGRIVEYWLLLDRLGIERQVETTDGSTMGESDRRTVVSDEYGRADHAQRHPSTAGSQDQMDPGQKARCLADLDRDGYTIIENVFDPEQVQAVRAEVEPLFLHRGGRNEFEGFKTRRLYSPLDDTWVLDRFIDHPIALGLLDGILEPNYLLSQLQVIDIAPGENAQGLHPDDGFYPWPRPRPPLSAATIIAIEDFTADNGATVVIPGSHRWDDRPPTPADIATATPAVMPAGSMLLFLGTTWHGGGANHTDRSRMCVTAQYCAPWCRPQENFSLSASRDRAAQSSEHLQRLLGYSIHPPFMGFVRGMHPKRLLEPGRAGLT